MLYRLIVLTGPLKNQRITVDNEPMAIGRAPDCQVVLPDDEVALKHALLELRPEGGLYIRDLGTMNKLIVNGRESRGSRLKHGDMVEIGHTRFLVQAVVQAEVDGADLDPDERHDKKVFIAVAVVVVLAVVTWVRWPQLHSKSPPKKTADAVSTSVGVVAAATNNRATAGPTSDNQSTQVTTEIQTLREDVAALRETMMARPPGSTSVTPPVIVAPAPPMQMTLADAMTDDNVATISQLGRVIRVLNVQQTRFPYGDDFDEMRTFNIVLSQTDSHIKIDNDDVRLDLSFYDEDQRSNNVHQSEAVAPLQGLKPASPWGEDRRCAISATYVLPKGARQRAVDAGRDERYYGFVVRVFYRDKLQDEWALPRALLDIEPETPAVADTNMTNLVTSTDAVLKPPL